ncbi:MAG TPA: hypothetical protein VLG76_01765 [Rhabdochlamydiaceae bacterium]|nr:hypothetical protein [Rhabdochlamydiaceae bacterium]
MSSSSKKQLENNPKIKKGVTTLLDDFYNTPRTSLIFFHFEPHPFQSADLRMQNCAIKHASLDGKDLYILDGFFEKSEGEAMQAFSKKATFSRNSYGSPEAIERGEKPAGSMNGKERWQFFSNPPSPILELYKLVGMIAHRINAEITTLPWELCDKKSHGSPAIIANLLAEASNESMDLGKHQDCNPATGISFAIPVLYSADKATFDQKFINGDPGKPWIVSVMLYATDEAYLPEYCMGTVFYRENGELSLSTNCSNMRLVIFEGDIFHSIEESKIPSGINTWRVSYIFKLIINPHQENQSAKKMFCEWISNLSKVETIPLGHGSRA